jgi:hypothetical protein
MSWLARRCTCILSCDGAGAIRTGEPTRVAGIPSATAPEGWMRVSRRHAQVSVRGIGDDIDGRRDSTKRICTEMCRMGEAGLLWLLLECLEDQVKGRLRRSAEMSEAGFQEHITQTRLTRLCSQPEANLLRK